MCTLVRQGASRERGISYLAGYCGVVEQDVVKAQRVAAELVAPEGDAWVARVGVLVPRLKITGSVLRGC